MVKGPQVYRTAASWVHEPSCLPRTATLQGLWAEGAWFGDGSSNPLSFCAICVTFRPFREGIPGLKGAGGYRVMPPKNRKFYRIES